MIKITITPRAGENIYGLLVKKELSLRSKNQGTLHRAGGKKSGEDKWKHSSYPGWVRFQKCLGGVSVALVQARNPDEEWQLLQSFIGFLHRHFRDSISSITLTYE